MANRAKVLRLADGDRERLGRLAASATVSAREHVRSKVLLLKADGRTDAEVADKMDVDPSTVRRCVARYEAGGLEAALADAPGRGRKQEISESDRLWAVSLACTRPKDVGRSAEFWYPASFARYVNEVAEAQGHPRMATVSESTLRRIMDEAKVRPFALTYYCERRDPEFDEKMHNVLLVYKQLSMQFDEDGNLVPQDGSEAVHVLSYDEKPGIQAVAATSDDLMPDAGHGTRMRDYEYRRRGTLSLLAGIDLQTGEAIPLVSETHNSGDYVAFLKVLDAKYPKGDRIRLVLDNLRVHTSQETRRYLATVPGRFEFVFTPKHGSWLNMVEGFFSKMTRQMLRGIRVSSKEELKERIYRYFEEVNREPVVYRWKYRLDEVDVSEDVVVDTLPLKQSS